MSHAQGRSSTRSFDGIARIYRALEYASFGRALERTRAMYLPQLGSARHALVLGDGDGRFLAALLDWNRELRAVAVDASSSMLELLTMRCRASAERLTTRHGDLCADVAGVLVVPERDDPFDLVVTHFFLDCLTERELEELVRSVRPRLSPSARWVISEFRAPPHGVFRVVGQSLIRLLYFGFRLLTALRVRRVPDYAAALTRAGFAQSARHVRLRGLLVSEMWQLPSTGDDVRRAGGTSAAETFTAIRGRMMRPTPPLTR